MAATMFSCRRTRCEATGQGGRSPYTIACPCTPRLIDRLVVAADEDAGLSAIPRGRGLIVVLDGGLPPGIR